MFNKTFSNFTFNVDDKNQPFDIDLKKIYEKDNVLEIMLTIKSAQRISPKKIRISFTYPCVDIFSTWSPHTYFNKAILPEWTSANVTKSRLAEGMPVRSLVSAGGMNRLTFAISDAAVPAILKTGIIEETAEFSCYAELFTSLTDSFLEYNTVLRIDTRNIPYYDAINDVSHFWEEKSGYKSAYIPEEAKMPLYSAWYSFHQDIVPEEIVKQCVLAKELGMRSIIVDDGWQTDDSSRGYTYCGDWNPAKSKIPNMKEFVAEVHKAGLKFILWYGTSICGTKSAAYKRFFDKLLDPGAEKIATYDLRFGETRKYLADKIVDSVFEWDLDGLKLDFLERFKLHEESSCDYDKMDCKSVEEAVEKLLCEITERIKKKKPEFLIEFRQSYVGPIMKKYGNMLRVWDCPDDALTNRVMHCDLRLTSWKTPVHSDMLMWNINEPVENAALQIINVLFAVPQISILIDKLPDDHRKMLKFYLDFWIKNRNILLDGKFIPENPEANYTLVSSKLNNEKISAAYSKNIAVFDGDINKLTIVNGSTYTKFVIENEGELREISYKIYDCTGNLVSGGTKNLERLSVFDIPLSGILEIEHA